MKVNVEFFETEDKAIDRCRSRNFGLNSNDPRCMAVIVGPGCINPEHAASARLMLLSIWTRRGEFSKMENSNSVR